MLSAISRVFIGAGFWALAAAAAALPSSVQPAQFHTVRAFDAYTVVWPRKNAYGLADRLDPAALQSLESCNASTCPAEARALGALWVSVSFLPEVGEVHAYYNSSGRLIATGTVPRSFTDQQQRDAFRLLSQATFGASPGAMNDLLNMGHANWLDTQLSAPYTGHYGRLMAAIDEAGFAFRNNTGSKQRLRMDVWWDRVLNGDDQLRQKVAYALSQIFVVSEKDTILRPYPEGIAHYNDTLLRHAFGNFGTLLRNVTLHPMMGNYLNMRGSRKANAAGTIFPDENYAREIMQLFTIGLIQLELDGSPTLDDTGNEIPTYDQEDIKSLARIFSGWNYALDPDTGTRAATETTIIQPMEPLESRHDTDAKRFLGHDFPQGSSATAELDQALNLLANHPNTAPFISKQLIQRLVTSNPSPGYVARVAGVFQAHQADADQLQAVLRAILTDTEATAADLPATGTDTGGKPKEPLLKVAQIWRAFNVAGSQQPPRFSNSDKLLGQKPFSANSVFNFYFPDYAAPGAIADQGLNSPELQILTDTTAITSANLIRWVAVPAESTRSSDLDLASLNLGYARQLARDDTQLLRYFDRTLLGGRMSDAMRSDLQAYWRSSTLPRHKRVYELLFLIASSPEFSYQR